MSKNFEQKDRVVIRFAGDSGDGMQLTGTRFTETSALFGNDLATLPDFPAEIRAPAGSLAGVSAFQLQFSSQDIHTPGDEPDVLIAMNPAALKVHLEDLPKGGYLIVNENAFTKKNLKFAGYEENPLEDGSLDSYSLFSIKMSEMVKHSCEGLDLTPKLVDRTKNFFALGVCFWMFDRPLDPTIKFLKKKFLLILFLSQVPSLPLMILTLKQKYIFLVCQKIQLLILENLFPTQTKTLLSIFLIKH